MTDTENNSLDLKVENLDNFTGFKRKGPNDAGFDLYAGQDIEIPAGGTVSVPCGIKTQFNPGWFLKIEGRSGLALEHNLQPRGGVIDCTYRGEIGAIIHNSSDEPYSVTAGDRIAQILPIRIDQNGFEFVDSVESNEERGEEGFGSSGK